MTIRPRRHLSYTTLSLGALVAVLAVAYGVRTVDRPLAQDPPGGESHSEMANEYINSGSPRMPYDMRGDWFTDRSRSELRLSLDEAMAEVGNQYTPLLRSENDLLVPTESATIDGALLRDGRELVALNVRYHDRIVLHITPTDGPLPVAEKLDAVSTPNTEGETRVNYQTTVRKQTAIARDAGIQKWEVSKGASDIFIIEYPAVLTWVEADVSGQLLTYSLVGDGPVETLKKIAESMKATD